MASLFMAHSVRRDACCRRVRAFLRELIKDFSSDSCDGLAAAIGKDQQPKLLLGDHSNIGRAVAEAAVLLDDRDVGALDDLPGKSLRELRAYGENTVLRQRHRVFQRAMLAELAEIGGQKGGHVARRRVDLGASRESQYALLFSRST